MSLSCDMELGWYPHDTQQCAIQIESLSHTTEKLVFEWDPHVPVDVFDNIQLPAHHLMNYTIGDCTQVYATGFCFSLTIGNFLS